jgi:hypothetical protein
MTFYRAGAGRTARPYEDLKTMSYSGATPSGSLSVLGGLYRSLAHTPRREKKYGPLKIQDGSGKRGPVDFITHIAL